MADITDDTAATVAAMLTQAVTAIKVERQLNAIQDDPERDVADTYVRMLRFTRQHGAGNVNYRFRGD